MNYNDFFYFLNILKKRWDKVQAKNLITSFWLFATSQKIYFYKYFTYITYIYFLNVVKFIFSKQEKISYPTQIRLPYQNIYNIIRHISITQE